MTEENEQKSSDDSGEAKKEEQASGDGGYEEVLESYFNDEPSVRTQIHINVDTKFADAIAQRIAELKETSDVFLVTGDIDIVVTAHFDSYSELKNFILSELSSIKGIKETKTFLIVSTYKRLGRTF